MHLETGRALHSIGPVTLDHLSRNFVAYSVSGVGTHVHELADDIVGGLAVFA